MPYEKNKTAFQDDEWFARERNIIDVRNWNRDLMGQTFYQICHNNKNKYRTIQFKWNPFVESLKPMISDPIYGAPPLIGTQSYSGDIHNKETDLTY